MDGSYSSPELFGLLQRKTMQTNYLLKILLFMTMTAVSSVSALSAATNEDITGCVSQSDKAGSIRDSEGASWSPLYYIKTNMLGWPCLWVNFEGETDFAPHWSAAIAVYYSGWDYFHRDTKFRTFSVMPEIRYWFQGRNDGFFMGAHCGASYYNIALAGKSRYQDHDGNTPAVGGGFTIGYRLPLRNPRWKLEFAAGGGAYYLDYDIFENRVNGSLIGRRHRVFYGLDKVAVSICYTFGDLKGRKGGER